jgi:glycosyltransferase involved in cell wall biosynthesis
MLCGCPVIASDRVGAVRDLIAHGETGYVYPCGDTTVLAKTMRDALQDPNSLASIQTNALAKIRTWSPQASAEALVVAVEAAISRRRSNSEVVAVSSEKYT